MRYAIFGDIHANMEAMDAVIADIANHKVDRLVCLGDIVGYGADPVACVEKIKELDCVTVAGNHDMVAVGMMNPDSFNLFARIAALWTRNSLNDESRAFLKDLPLTATMNNFQITHSNLFAPSLFEYIQTSYDAMRNFECQEKPLCFVGHSHIPVTLVLKQDTIVFTLDSEIDVEPNVKMIVNVGSIGQPRDENPMSSYALYDSEMRKIVIKRVSYNIEKTCKKIVDAKLPEINAERLRYGR